MSKPLTSDDIEVAENAIKAEHKNAFERVLELQRKIDDWVREERLISPDALDALWKSLQKLILETLPEEDRGKPNAVVSAKRVATLKLFDLHTGPLLRSLTTGRTTNRYVFTHGSESHRRRAFGQTVFDANAFLAEPQLARSVGRRQDATRDGFSPDDFARAIVEGENDGIILLAGMRGSGKSSLLNLIRWYARQPLEERGPPLLVDFDLGATFDEARFSRDLIFEVCRAGQEQLGRYPRKASAGWFRRGYSVLLELRSVMVRMVGTFATVCVANMVWAAVVLLAMTLCLVYGLATVPTGLTVGSMLGPVLFGDSAKNDASLESIPGDKDDERAIEKPASARMEVPASELKSGAVGDIQRIVERLTSSNTKAPTAAVEKVTLPVVGETSSADFTFLWFAVFSVLLIGITRNVALILGAAPDSERRTGGRQRTESLRLASFWVSLIAFMAIVAVAMAPEATSLRQWVQPLYPVAMLAFLAAVLALPWWWDRRGDLSRIQTRIAARPQEGNPFAEFVAAFGGAAFARLLPRGESAEGMKEVSIPFTQELAKEAFKICADSFSRVVVLIDDVDALPSEKLHEFLRLIRPLTKVPGVTCVAAVPAYFYPIMYGTKQLGDIQSTVREVVILGDPQLFEEGEDGRFHVRHRKRVRAKRSCAAKDCCGALPSIGSDRGEAEAEQRRAGLIEGRDRFLRALLRGKLRLKWAESSSAQLAEPLKGDGESVFDFALRAWCQASQKKAATVWTRQLERYGQSRREFIRLIHDSVERGAFKSVNAAREVESMKSGHDISETILQVNSKRREERQDAIEKLRNRLNGGHDADFEFHRRSRKSRVLRDPATASRTGV